MESQKTLPTENIVVFVDTRENNNIIDYLKECGADVRQKQLLVGDYICSDRVGIEKKTIRDFLGSISNQRIFQQIRELKESFEKPVFLIEGNPEMLYYETNVHPNSIRGVLASIAINYGIPILWSSNIKESAEMIFWIAKREQTKRSTEISIRTKPKEESLPKNQEYLVAGLPNVSNVLSKRLLKEFKTVKKVFSASESRLKKVEGIGEEKAKKIFDVLNKEYTDEKV